jgi:small subunit ribosomal protein S5
MSDQVKTTTETNNTAVQVNPAQVTASVTNKYERNNRGRNSNNRGRRPDRRDNSDEKKGEQLETKIITIRRVTKMHQGGRRMKISVVVVVGDKKGKVGIGVGKGDDVKSAQEKATNQAKKNMVFVKLKGNTIPHETTFKFKSSRILLKPAAPGTGIVAGSSVRLVAEVAGISDVLGKILGAENKITNAYATIHALASLRTTRL